MNATINVSADGASDGLPAPEWKTIVLAVVLYSIVLTTIFGNLLVLLAVLKDRRLRTSFNLYIVNLALTDFGVAITAMSFHTTNTILGFWPFGEVMCAVWIFFDYGMTFVSVFTLLLISVDRLWSVTWSVHYKLHHTRRFCLLSIAAIWVFMLVLWIPPWIWDRVENSVPNECFWDPAKNMVFVIIVAVLGHHGSCIILLVCYIRVFMFMHKRKSLVTDLPAANYRGGATTSGVTADEGTAVSVIPAALPSTSREGGGPSSNQMCENANLGLDAANSASTSTNTIKPDENSTKAFAPNSGNEAGVGTNRVTTKKDRKVFITLSYVIIGYVVCWVPFHIVFDISSTDPSLVPPDLFNFTFWLAYTNSTINPLLYHFSSAEFRRAFKKLLCRR